MKRPATHITALAVGGALIAGGAVLAAPSFATDSDLECQHYSWTGGPLEEGVVPAPPPGGSWQANTTKEPHLNNPNITWYEGTVGEGLHYASRGGSGKADWFYYGCEEPEPTPTPTPTPTETPTPTPTPTPTETPTPTPTPTPTDTPTETPTPTPTPTSTPTQEGTPTPTPPSTPPTAPPAAPPAEAPAATTLPKTGSEAVLGGIGALLAAIGALTVYLGRRFG